MCIRDRSKEVGRHNKGMSLKWHCILVFTSEQVVFFVNSWYVKGKIFKIEIDFSNKYI